MRKCMALKQKLKAVLSIALLRGINTFVRRQLRKLLLVQFLVESVKAKNSSRNNPKNRIKRNACFDSKCSSSLQRRRRPNSSL